MIGSKTFILSPKEDITYFGESDLLAQIADELRNCPNSCFSQNVFSWYNAEYSALSGVQGCKYQIAIDLELCPECEEVEQANSLEDVIDVISGFISGSPRRVGRAAIRIICREALRRNKERTAPGV